MTVPIARIGEFCQVGDGTHSRIPRQESGVRYLTSRNFKDGGLDVSSVYYISEQDFDRHFGGNGKALTKPEYGDLVFSIIGTIGEPYLVRKEDKFGVSSSVAIVRPDKKVLDPEFLFYWFKGPEFQQALFGIKGGVAQGYVSLEMIRSLPVPCLPIPVQRRIAGILSAYDDLIENNQRRIKILEDMARSLYREWFVNFRFPGHEKVPLVDSPLGSIPKGWEVKPVPECVHINPRVIVPRDRENPFVRMGSLCNDSMLINDIDFRTGNNGAKFQNGDTLLARITPCLENGKTGFVQFLSDAKAVACGSTEFIVLRSGTLTSEFVYCLARSEEFRGIAIKSMSGATGRQRVQERCFDDFQIAQPPRPLLDRFSAIVAASFRLIYNLYLRIQKLRETRDLLLPRLLDGHVPEKVGESANG